MTHAKCDVMETRSIAYTIPNLNSESILILCQNANTASNQSRRKTYEPQTITHIFAQLTYSRLNEREGGADEGQS
jgi:hypothetical protein